MGLRERLEDQSSEELKRVYKEGPAAAQDNEHVREIACEILEERGEKIPKNVSVSKTHSATTAREYQKGSDSWLSNYFSFRKFISTGFIRFFYLLGFLAITIGAIVAMVQGEELGGRELLIPGILALTIGNIAWRVFCESLIVVFDIHDTLTSIDVHLDQISE